MSVILGWLWNNKKLIAAGIAVLAVAGYISALKYQIHSRDKDIAKLSAEIVTLNSEVMAAQATAKRLEASLQVIVDDGKRKTANSQMWRAKYEQTALSLQTTLTSLNGFTQKPTESDCDAAKRLLEVYRK